MPNGEFPARQFSREIIPGSGSNHKRPRIGKRVLARQFVPQAAAPLAVEPVFETDAHSHRRLQLRQEGWYFWEWQKHRIHYVAAGPEDAPPILLIHGFGASAYHWRYNIPELAQKFRVYAVDLLGFGWSDKALVSYDGYSIWQEQLSDFIKQVAGGRPVVLVGNSLGGYNSLATAAKYPQLVRGIVLVNAAGRFEEVKEAVEAPVEAALSDAERSGLEASLELASDAAAASSAEPVKQTESSPAQAAQSRTTASDIQRRQDPGPSKPFGLGQPAASPSLMQRLVSPLKTMAMRTAVYASFIAAKQPSRIRSVLKQVYTDDTNIDDDLVQSIAQPAKEKSAAEVFYRVITANGTPVNELLGMLKTHSIPMLLLWGDYDPWIRPSSADRIQRLYPLAERFSVPAGHCPHDDLPEPVNKALLEWLDHLP